MKDIPGNPHIDIVFDGPPDHNGGRLIEVEDASGNSMALRSWFQRTDGHWVLRLTADQITNPPRGTARKS